MHHRPELGGAPRSLYYLLELLDRDRFEPHVYCPPGAAADLFRSADVTVYEGPVAAFTHIWASRYVGRRWLMLGAEARRLAPHLAALQRVLAEKRFPLVHLNDSPLVAAAPLAARHGARIVWHVRGSLASEGRDTRSRLLQAAIRRYASRVIAINESVAASFPAVPQIEVVHNSVDLERFAPRDAREARLEAGIDPDMPTVGFFSFIYPLKGYTSFIEAARACRDRGIRAQFVIVGGGVRDAAFFRTPRGRLLAAAGFVSDHEQLARELVTRHGLGDIVHFVPFTPHPDVFYAASDVVVAPSQGPELGRSLIEAAATGRPVIASGSPTGGGVVLPDETGLLVPGAEPSELAAAIGALLESPQRRAIMGRRARAHAVDRFDAARNTRRIEAIYEEVLAEAAPARPRRRITPPGAEDRLRLLFVTPYYAPAWGFGGPPRVTWDLTRGLARRGHDVRVFTTDALDFHRRATPRHESFDGVAVTRYRNVSNQFVWRTKKFLPPELVGRVLADASSYDLVHVTETRTVPTAAGYLATRRGDLPLAISAHGSLPGSTGIRGLVKRAYDHALVEPMLREASLLLAQTTHEAELYLAHGGRPDAVRMLPLPVDLSDLGSEPGARQRFRAAHGISQSDRVVMFLGRLHYLKGVDILMEAVKGAHAVDSSVKLVVVGRDDGAWKGLAARFEEEFRNRTFQFVGPLYGRDRVDAYVGCDTFAITPRLWEETSLSALEAAACGRPVVLTPQAEIPGLVEAGAGAMPELEPEAITTALLDTLARAEEMGPAARALVEANHSVDAVVRQLEACYRDAIAARAR